MTNLLPPVAKKQVTGEYWTRMVCVWVLVWSISLFVGVLLLWPTYVLLTGNNEAYEASTTAATERTYEYEELSKKLESSSVQAREIVSFSKQQLLSSVIKDIGDVTDTSVITVNSISVSTKEDALQPFNIGGDSRDRQSLANFRDALETLPYVASVDLPIENLAKNENISFQLSVDVTSDKI